jgi:hypothetical protein
MTDLANVIPDVPWIPLEVAIELAIKTGLVPGYTLYEGERWITGDTLEPLSKLFGREAFSGRLRLRGWPTAPHGEVPTGPEQDIPLTYFARERSFYGEVGIGRLPFEASKEDERRDHELSRTSSPGPDRDWLDVLVSGPDLRRLVGAARAENTAKLPRKRPGPKPHALLAAASTMRAWLIEARAKSGGQLPKTSLGLAKACFEARRDEVGLPIDTMRKIFGGAYGPALKLAEDGQLVAFWEKR